MLIWLDLTSLWPMSHISCSVLIPDWYLQSAVIFSAELKQGSGAFCGDLWALWYDALLFHPFFTFLAKRGWINCKKVDAGGRVCMPLLPKQQGKRSLRLGCTCEVPPIERNAMQRQDMQVSFLWTALLPMGCASQGERVSPPYTSGGTGKPYLWKGPLKKDKRGWR